MKVVSSGASKETSFGIWLLEVAITYSALFNATFVCFEPSGVLILVVARPINCFRSAFEELIWMLFGLASPERFSLRDRLSYGVWLYVLRFKQAHPILLLVLFLIRTPRVILSPFRWFWHQ